MCYDVSTCAVNQQMGHVPGNDGCHNVLSVLAVTDWVKK